ncbi:MULTISPECIES: hypothetical protein [unclassified Halomonas]|uniref:hypothetical protein n=1 Tax=unclassified Halomonas TaxID=2609666 RepID=UPI0009907A89|nr:MULTISPECIES: hypothetical protein [unclassified Halomonas]AQU83443.1 hypothetical protein B2G49_13200 [Halomonas sp. 'Soap Lake \
MSYKRIRQEDYIKVLGQYINKKDRDSFSVVSGKKTNTLDGYFKLIIKYKKSLQENEGADPWEFYKDTLIEEVKKLFDIQSIKNNNEVVILDVLIVFLNEIYEISGNLKVKEEVDNLQEVRGFIKSNNKSKENLFSCYRKYVSIDKEKLSQFRKINAADSFIRKEVEDKFKSYENREARLAKELNDIKESLSYLRGDTSFLYSSKAFHNLEKSVKTRVMVSFSLTIFIGAITLMYFGFVAYLLISDSNFLSGYSLGEGGVRVPFWQEIRLYDVKMLLISSTIIFLGVYFFRVVLDIYQRNARKLEDYEFKAVIAFYIEGYMKFVQDSGVDCESSIRKYEDFIFNKDLLDRSDVEPKPTDALKDIGEVTERLLKASRK